jgi:hypothetical protein
MKVDGVHAAYERYDQQRSEDHRVDPVLPEDTGRVHAYRELLSFWVKPGHPGSPRGMRIGKRSAVGGSRSCYRSDSRRPIRLHVRSVRVCCRSQRRDL